MKSLDEYKDFSEHECPFCKGIDINMKICLHCYKKWWVQYQLCGIEANTSTL